MKIEKNKYYLCISNTHKVNNQFIDLIYDARIGRIIDNSFYSYDAYFDKFNDLNDTFQVGKIYFSQHDGFLVNDRYSNVKIDDDRLKDFILYDFDIDSISRKIIDNKHRNGFNISINPKSYNKNDNKLSFEIYISHNNCRCYSSIESCKSLHECIINAFSKYRTRYAQGIWIQKLLPNSKNKDNSSCGTF